MAVIHTFTPEDNKELDAVIFLLREERSLLMQAHEFLEKALEACRSGDIPGSVRLGEQAYECKLKALDIKDEAIDRYEALLKHIAPAERRTTNVTTGDSQDKRL